MDKYQANGQMLKQMFLAAVNKLNAEKASVDSLNVFPVPDGDTGTNMSLTLNSVGKFISRIDESKLTVGKVASEMAYGALMGARGNSGVILSQILGGFSKALAHEEVLTPKLLAAAFSGGVEAAYKAVVKPMEGTILTVAREAGAYLNEKLTNESTLEDGLRLYLEEGYRSLARTPEILPVLKQAGVVDAGAKGLLIMVEGMLSGLLGESIETIATVEENFSMATDEHYFANPDDIVFQYCTELIIRNKSSVTVDVSAVKAYLTEVGDSVLVVSTNDVTKIHVHTNNPGKVLEYGITIGDLNDVKIENMKAQAQANFVSTEPVVPKETAIIVVSAGEGLNEIFKSMGADMIITGGQTMNPSTEEFIDAIGKVNAKKIILLPNNKNIILTAEQAAKLTEDAQVFVVPSRTIVQGISALMAYNGENEVEHNVQKMTQALSQVVSGELTYAVRDANLDGHTIKEGQILGIIDGKIAAVGDDVRSLLKETLDLMPVDDYELVTLYYGEDVQQKEAQELLSWLEEEYPDIDFELHDGTQAVYFYLISAE